MYNPSSGRYESMLYRRCGHSGLMLPTLSLGLWHNFGAITPFDTQRSILTTAFDAGITHFDLANNYGPPYGEAERNFGAHMRRDFLPFRDELIISTKAGYDMWPGPYGNWGGKKYLTASIDQSLKRMNLDYVDIFYHHRPDPQTPIEETMGALAQIVKSGKALYVGISNYYTPDQALSAQRALAREGVPLLVNQLKYSMFERKAEGVLDTMIQCGAGVTAFSPLAGGLLTGKYLGGIPAFSRAGHDPRYLKPEMITDEKLKKIRALSAISAQRGESMTVTALSWVLRHGAVTSAIIGASRPEQIAENLRAVTAPAFTPEQLAAIDLIFTEA